jgi:hypothetical protein
MATRRRKPSDYAPYNLRIRQELRQRIAKAAAKNQTSENNEMRVRLEKSFEMDDQFTLSMITADMAKQWARWGETFYNARRMEDLLRATEQLIAAVERGEAVGEQIERAKAVMKTIDKV